MPERTPKKSSPNTPQPPIDDEILEYEEEYGDFLDIADLKEMRYYSSHHCSGDTIFLSVNGNFSGDKTISADLEYTVEFAATSHTYKITEIVIAHDKTPDTNHGCYSSYSYRVDGAYKKEFSCTKGVTSGCGRRAWVAASAISRIGWQAARRSISDSSSPSMQFRATTKGLARRT